jgi:hypothetical protein
MQDFEDEVLRSFACNYNVNDLDAMHEGCEDSALEMKYLYVDLRMASKIKMLMRSEEIKEHSHKLKKAKPPCSMILIFKRYALERLMED